VQVRKPQVTQLFWSFDPSWFTLFTVSLLLNHVLILFAGLLGFR
jgi:hypothetical protein